MPASTPLRAGMARLGGVPAVPGAGDPGAGLLHRQPAERHQGVRPCRHRARHPPRATEHPVQSRVVQQARNLLMDLEDAARCPKESSTWIGSGSSGVTAPDP
ncbi:MAG: hypothetical protein M3Y33_07630 [Actinomycetota bacterium]|nr:hypothetical protein [Actinomycetota bacterium]